MIKGFESISDMLLSDVWGNRYAGFAHKSLHLSKEQIENGLNDENIVVRQAAYEHPCCTDEQKVAYHMKWGNLCEVWV